MISPYEILTMHAPLTHIYTCYASQIFVEESSSVQYSTYCTIQKRNTKIQCSPTFLGKFVSQLYKSHTIPSQIFTTYNSQSIVLVQIHFANLPKGTNNNTIFLYSKNVTHLAGPKKEEPGGLPQTTLITHN